MGVDEYQTPDAEANAFPFPAPCIAVGKVAAPLPKVTLPISFCTAPRPLANVFPPTVLPKTGYAISSRLPRRVRAVPAIAVSVLVMNALATAVAESVSVLVFVSRTTVAALLATPVATALTLMSPVQLLALVNLTISVP